MCMQTFVKRGGRNKTLLKLLPTVIMQISQGMKYGSVVIKKVLKIGPGRSAMRSVFFLNKVV